MLTYVGNTQNVCIKNIIKLFFISYQYIGHLKMLMAIKYHFSFIMNTIHALEAWHGIKAEMNIHNNCNNKL